MPTAGKATGVDYYSLESRDLISYGLMVSPFINFGGLGYDRDTGNRAVRRGTRNDNRKEIPGSECTSRGLEFVRGVGTGR